VGSSRNSATPFGVEKLEWLGYPMVKNFEDIFIHFGANHERDGHTDGQTPHAGNIRAMHGIARQLRNVLNTNFFLLHTKF